jgi:hypothetical protein
MWTRLGDRSNRAGCEEKIPDLFIAKKQHLPRLIVAVKQLSRGIAGARKKAEEHFHRCTSPGFANANANCTREVTP